MGTTEQSMLWLEDRDIRALRSKFSIPEIEGIPDLRYLALLLRREPPVEVADERAHEALKRLVVVGMRNELEIVAGYMTSGLMREASMRTNHELGISAFQSIIQKMGSLILNNDTINPPRITADAFAFD